MMLMPILISLLHISSLHISDEVEVAILNI